jgi:hypothetical protein
MPSMMKLYGQIIPKTKLGGCHGGRLSDAYQPGELETQIPEPKAYIKTRAIPTLAKRNLSSMAKGY